MAQEKHFNVDDAEEYDDGTRAVTYSDDERLHSDSETEATTTLSSSRKQRLQASSFKKTKQTTERASALRVKNWDAGAMDSAAYAGKVVKRKDVVEADEESPDEDAMADWSDTEPFGESEEEDKDDNEDDEQASNVESESSESEGSDDDDDQDAEKLIRGFQKEESAQLMNAKDTAKLVEKATHVRNQKLIWERSLEIQIYTKRLLTTTKDIANVVAASVDEDAKAALIDQLYTCIDAVSTLQDKLCNSSELSIESDEQARTSRKRTIDDVWSQITETNEVVLPQYNEILNTYSRKTNLAGGSQAKKFKAVNQDILAQVESVLADPLRVKRKAHAPIDTPTEGDNGHTTTEEDDSSDQLDELMYDDSDFYQQLLKELIESGGGSQDAVIRRTHRKKKKVINRKASKGRVLRYTVHPKLENFMFPEPYPASEMDVDELFRSIFGQARQA